MRAGEEVGRGAQGQKRGCGSRRNPWVVRLGAFISNPWNYRSWQCHRRTPSGGTSPLQQTLALLRCLPKMSRVITPPASSVCGRNREGIISARQVVGSHALYCYRGSNEIHLIPGIFVSKPPSAMHLRQITFRSKSIWLIVIPCFQVISVRHARLCESDHRA